MASLSRKDKREWLVKIAYEIGTEVLTPEEMQGVLEAHGLPTDDAYLSTSIQSFVDNRQQIDQIIKENIKGWSFERIPKVDIAILRIAINEILFSKSAPTRVAINEAVNIAKSYSNEESYKFINGVLSTVAKGQNLA